MDCLEWNWGVSTISYGGFSATSYNDGSLSLSFIVEEYGYSTEEDI